MTTLTIGLLILDVLAIVFVLMHIRNDGPLWPAVLLVILAQLLFAFPLR